MASLKSILAVTLPTTIILLIVSIIADWGPIIFGVFLILSILQGIFWRFVKWTF